MTNEQRRVALALARRKALGYAEEAEAFQDGKFGADERSIGLANMWANVANAMKVGQSLEADGVIPDIADITLTR